MLPFANIGGGPEQDYFVDGVTESLTTDLSRISGAFVIARNTRHASLDGGDDHGDPKLSNPLLRRIALGNLPKER
jgi:TolB-like protein